MPRAFLITHKRYNLQEPGTTTAKDRESSPESQVNTAESFAPIQSRLPTQNAGRFHCQEEEEDEPLELTTGGGKQQEQLLKERWEQPEVDFRRLSRTDSRSDEFYNLTKLAEVSLAAAAGELFYGDGSRDEWTEQERPEDLSSPFVDQKPVDVHACPECGKRYSTSSNLARHRQTHRSLADKKARTCPHCDKIYVSMPAFSMHVRTHNQGCKCSYCGKCFSRPWLLQGHIRTHTGEKPFKCTICGKAFADKSNLRAHVQTHSTMKPHICGRCGKAFALKSYLYKHEESSCMKAQLHVSDRKVPGQTKRFCSGRLKGHPLEKPILSIPTPVISVAIRV